MSWGFRSRQVADNLNQTGQQKQPRRHSKQAAPVPAAPIRTCKTPTGGIAARTDPGNVMTGVSCELYYIDDATDTLTASTENLTVWNPFRTAIAEDVIIQVAHFNGRWQVISEEC